MNTFKQIQKISQQPRFKSQQQQNNSTMQTHRVLREINGNVALNRPAKPLTKEFQQQPPSASSSRPLVPNPSICSNADSFRPAQAHAQGMVSTSPPIDQTTMNGLLPQPSPSIMRSDQLGPRSNLHQVTIENQPFLEWHGGEFRPISEKLRECSFHTTDFGPTNGMAGVNQMPMRNNNMAAGNAIVSATLQALHSQPNSGSMRYSSLQEDVAMQNNENGNIVNAHYNCHSTNTGLDTSTLQRGSRAHSRNRKLPTIREQRLRQEQRQQEQQNQHGNQIATRSGGRTILSARPSATRNGLSVAAFARQRAAQVRAGIGQRGTAALPCITAAETGKVAGRNKRTSISSVTTTASVEHGNRHSVGSSMSSVARPRRNSLLSASAAAAGGAKQPEAGNQNGQGGDVIWQKHMKLRRMVESICGPDTPWERDDAPLAPPPAPTAGGIRLPQVHGHGGSAPVVGFSEEGGSEASGLNDGRKRRKSLPGENRPLAPANARNVHTVMEKQILGGQPRDDEVVSHTAWQAEEEYASEIHISAMQRAGKDISGYDFLNHDEFDLREARKKVGCWLSRASWKYECSEFVFALAMGMMDRYLNTKRLYRPRERLQLLGVSCLFIASKYEDIWPLKLQKCVDLCAGLYDVQQIINMELDILNTLDFKLVFCTATTFLHLYRRRQYKQIGVKTSERQDCFAQYMIELFIVREQSLNHSHAVIAAAALYMSCIAGYMGDGQGVAIMPSPQSFTTVAALSGLDEGDIMSGCQDMLVAWTDTFNNKNCPLFRKFAKPNYGHLAFELVNTQLAHMFQSRPSQTNSRQPSYKDILMSSAKKCKSNSTSKSNKNLKPPFTQSFSSKFCAKRQFKHRHPRKIYRMKQIKRYGAMRFPDFVDSSDEEDDGSEFIIYSKCQ